MNKDSGGGCSHHITWWFTHLWIRGEKELEPFCCSCVWSAATLLPYVRGCCSVACRRGKFISKTQYSSIMRKKGINKQTRALLYIMNPRHWFILKGFLSDYWPRNVINPPVLSTVPPLSCMKSSNYKPLCARIIMNDWIKQPHILVTIFLESARPSDPMIAGAESPSDVLFCLCLCSCVGSLLGSQDRFRRRSPALPPAAGDRSALWYPDPSPRRHHQPPPPESQPIPSLDESTRPTGGLPVSSFLWCKSRRHSWVHLLSYSTQVQILFLFHYIS